MLLSACDSNQEQPFDPSGRWILGVSQAITGKCCDADIVIINNAGAITGSGTLTIPGDNAGEVLILAVDVRGAFSGDNMSINLLAPSGAFGTLSTSDSRSPGYREADFEGFGHSGKDIIFFKTVD